MPSFKLSEASVLILFSAPAAFADDLNIVNYAEIEASLKNGIRILNSDKELISQPTVKSVASPRAAARGLYDLRILAIQSPSANDEFPTQFQSSSLNDHGGGWIEVTSMEYGYGGNPRITMNGALQNGYEREPICSDSGVFNLCSATVSKSVIGWMYVTRIYGVDNGVFQHTNTGIASPWATLSKQIYVR